MVKKGFRRGDSISTTVRDELNNVHIAMLVEPDDSALATTEANLSKQYNKALVMEA